MFVHTQPSGERKQPINVYILGVFTEKLFCKPADDIHKYIFHCFSEKTRPDVPSESSARQRIIN